MNYLFIYLLEKKNGKEHESCVLLFKLIDYLFMLFLIKSYLFCFIVSFNEIK